MATDSREYPFPRHPDDPLSDRYELALAGSILSDLNQLLAIAHATGVSVGLCFRDAGAHDVSGDRLEAVEWRTGSSDEPYVVEMQNVVTISEAAKLIGVSRSAMRGRVHRAHRADRETPFLWSERRDCWLADPDAVKAWAASWTGQSAQRPPRSQSTPA